MPTKKIANPSGDLTHTGKKRTTPIFGANPIVSPKRVDAEQVSVVVFDYDENTIAELRFNNVMECLRFKTSNRVSWINIDGLRKEDVEAVCNHYGVHQLIAEDILSENQRPKMDEGDGVLFCLLNMLYFNTKEACVETEQVSIVLGNQFVISFQEDAGRDVFDPIRTKLQIPNSKLRQRAADYLCYTMLDLIVDNYFLVMEQLGEQIESLEEEIIRRSTSRSLARINQLRKELIVLKRNIVPVRELINGFVNNESDLIDERTTKYYKDVYDHIIQANDLTENYRDIMMGMQDLYINNVNLKMNEVMKVMAIVTCLLAPATVIGGMFGMNFDNIPFAHNRWGFYIMVFVMLVIPVWMLAMFKRRGWF